MISIVLTNRNRDLRIVKKCLDSLQAQTNMDFEWFLVDYGSDKNYLKDLELVLQDYSKIKFISCPTQGQLWNKSRAINIVLNQCNSPFFFVGDIDMIFHSEFIQELKNIASLDRATYFQVGFLSQNESQKNNSFEDYQIAFKSTDEATGMTLYPTAVLKSINGYDEFYHGWGAEDTDVHIRLKNKGFDVVFFDKKVLMKHQWHPKKYRSKESLEPYHSQLEKINHRYIKQVKDNQIVVANKDNQIGILPLESKYNQLEKIDKFSAFYSEVNEIDAFLYGTIHNLAKGVYQFDFKQHSLENDFKNSIKNWLGKRAFKFYSLDEINDKLLLILILNFRNSAYSVVFDRVNKVLQLKIVIE